MIFLCPSLYIFMENLQIKLKLMIYLIEEKMTLKIIH